MLQSQDNPMAPNEDLCLSEYRLDRHFMGLESPQEHTQTQKHISQCPVCQKELAERQALQKEAHTIAIPGLKISPWQQLIESMKRFFSPSSSGFYPLVTVASIACLGLLIYNTLPDPENPETTPKQVRKTPKKPQKVRQRTKVRKRYLLKGTKKPQWIIALQRKGQRRLARSGEFFEVGDLLVLAYQWGMDGFVYTVYRDTKNDIAPIFPRKAKQKSLPISKGIRLKRPGSLEVEGKPEGQEELWTCFSRKPLSFQDVEEALPKQRPSDLRWSPGPAGKCLFLHRFVLNRR